MIVVAAASGIESSRAAAIFRGTIRWVSARSWRAIELITWDVVLRAQAGQLYELSDGARVCLGRIESVGRDRVEFALLEELPANRTETAT